jgi:hypothetical protein
MNYGLQRNVVALNRSSLIFRPIVQRKFSLSVGGDPDGLYGTHPSRCYWYRHESKALIPNPPLGIVIQATISSAESIKMTAAT